MLIFSSFQSKDTVNSEWSSLFWIDILLPWLTGVGVAILVMKKNGRDLKREIWNPIIPRMPRVMLPPHLRFQDPKTEETPVLEFIGSEISSERSINITEIQLETTHVPKYPEEVLNTGNAELHVPNVITDLKDCKKTIKTEPEKAHEPRSVIKGKGKGKGKGHSRMSRSISFYDWSVEDTNLPELVGACP